MMTNAFQRRLLLGWINDNSDRPLSGKRWPITDIDERTVAEYKTYLQTARDYGYTGITLWGLYADHAWKVPLAESLEPKRRRLIDQILHEAERLGIKTLYGLGVYGWGFEEIIRHDPTTARDEGRMAWGSFQSGNGVVMCYQSESARQWMRAVVDLCAREVGTQGFGFQPADLGRCYCHECRQMSDSEYYGRIVNETAEYVRANYPGQILGVSAWGLDLGGGEDSLRLLTQNLDFLTDVTDQSARKGRAYRKTLTAELPCALGSLGGAIFVPPQRWERERWFLPHAERTGRNIKTLHEDGGRAFEFFMGPLVNPQYAIMTRFVGLLLQDPDRSIEQALTQVIEDLCRPIGSAAANDIAHWLLEVEEAYFSRLDAEPTGEFDFEPLKGEAAGEPIYLMGFSAEKLSAYRNDLGRLAQRLPTFAAHCRQPEPIIAIERCLGNVLNDIYWVQEQAK